MSLWIAAGAVSIAIGAFEILRRPKKKTCVEVHSRSGLNYPWLRDIHGGLDYIQYEEPAGSGIWRNYDRRIWEIHCRAISHSPDQLTDAHDKAFINPATRFARLAFHFRDGAVVEPIREWYELEADYFRNRM